MSLLHQMIPTQRNGSAFRWDEFSPITEFQRDLGRMAEDLTRTFRWAAVPYGEGYAEFSPKVNVKDDKDALTLTAELPGMTEKDVEVSITKDSVTLKGEKKSEKEEKRKDYFRMERTYGSFERVIALPHEVDHSKAEATFKHGVLAIHMPKSAQAKVEGKRLQIKTA